VDLATLQFIHTHKTGAMILVSVQTGAGLGAPRRRALTPSPGMERVGLAFQIADDILDVEGKVETPGRLREAIARRGKPPILRSWLEESRRRQGTVEGALEALSDFGAEADPLRKSAVSSSRGITDRRGILLGRVAVDVAGLTGQDSPVKIHRAGLAAGLRRKEHGQLTRSDSIFFRR